MDSVKYNLVVLCILLVVTTFVVGNEFRSLSYSSDAPEESCQTPNDCVSVNGRPYCIRGVCRPCNPEMGEKHNRCQCGMGEYCVSYTNDTNYATCRPLESTILDSNCDSSLDNHGMDLVQSVNDTVFCGKVVFGTNNLPLHVEWNGICIKGICKQCYDGPVTCAPFAKCEDGRTCFQGKEIMNPIGVFDPRYAIYAPQFLGFYVMVTESYISLFIIIISVVALGYYQAKQKQAAVFRKDLAIQ